MNGSKKDMQITQKSGSMIVRGAKWGDMHVTLESYPADHDSASHMAGHVDDLCQCPHWGYVIKGHFLVRYADHEETVEEGDVYYLPPGHTTYFFKDTELAEFSHQEEYEKTLSVVARNSPHRFENLQELES